MLLLATSSATIKREHLDLMYNRELCADRRGFFDHLTPNRLAYNVSIPMVTRCMLRHLTFCLDFSSIHGAGNDDFVELLER